MVGLRLMGDVPEHLCVDGCGAGESRMSEADREEYERCEGGDDGAASHETSERKGQETWPSIAARLIGHETSQRKFPDSRTPAS